MDTKKLQNIIIIILLLLNVFLLFVVLSDALQTQRSEKATVTVLTELLAENGIEVSTGDALVQEAIPTCTVVRNAEQEKQKMKALIGNSNAEDLGGSILFYRGSGGQAVARGTGEMEMLMGGKSIAAKRDPAKAAVQFFEKAGIALDPNSAQISGDEYSPTVQLNCMWNGKPVYNAKLDFDYSGDQLYMISGVRVFDAETESEKQGAMDSVSALMRFVEIVKNEGFICSRLTGLGAGYLMNVTISGESTLTPLWRIETDTGAIYINALNGRTENMPA